MARAKLLLWPLLHLLLCHATHQHDTQVVTTDCLRDIRIYGPGWEQPELLLPSRYFFVDHVPNCDKRVVRATIVSRSKSRCLAKMQTFNQTLFSHDLVIFRYRLVTDECDNFDILLYDNVGDVVAKRHVKGSTLSDDCHCATEANRWKDKMRCDATPELYKRIEQDLK